MASTAGLGEGDASASPTPDADVGMAEMSKRFQEEGGELYIPAAE